MKMVERLQSPLIMTITQWWKQSAGTTRVKWTDGKSLSVWVLIWLKWMSRNFMMTKDCWSHSFIRWRLTASPCKLIIVTTKAADWLAWISAIPKIITISVLIITSTGNWRGNTIFPERDTISLGHLTTIRRDFCSSYPTATWRKRWATRTEATGKTDGVTVSLCGRHLTLPGLWMPIGDGLS